MRCPLCGFQKIGESAAEAVWRCPRCQSTPEDRQLTWFVSTLQSLSPQAKVIDVSPPHARWRHLPNLLGGARYTAIGIPGEPHLPVPHRSLQMRITRLAFSDRAFELILCPHVLSEIRSDYMAMAEIHRCLKDDGCAVLTETLLAPKTVRYVEWDGHAERPLAWAYGEDYLERLEAAGFFPLRLHLDALAGGAAEEFAFGPAPRIILGFKFRSPLKKFEEALCG